MTWSPSKTYHVIVLLAISMLVGYLAAPHETNALASVEVNGLPKSLFLLVIHFVTGLLLYLPLFLLPLPELIVETQPKPILAHGQFSLAEISNLSTDMNLFAIFARFWICGQASGVGEDVYSFIHSNENQSDLIVSAGFLIFFTSLWVVGMAKNSATFEPRLRWAVNAK